MNMRRLIGFKEDNWGKTVEVTVCECELGKLNMQSNVEIELNCED